MPPRITMIIPTRERHDTLLWALKTCVTQDHDDFEILVSDNASTDATREVVDSYDDKRIRYVNPGRRLAMSEHWEFALSHVTSGHFSIIGDDDGVMPHGVEDMAEILASEPTPALIWPVHSYYWPGYVDTSIANSLSMVLDQPATTHELAAAPTLAEVMRFRLHAHQLPSPYWGLVSIDAVNQARNSQGVFFNSITPDLYAGVALASVVDRYLRTPRALTLSGESRHSNGAAQITGLGAGASPYTTFIEENKARFHRDLDYASNIEVLLAETFLQARDHVARGRFPDFDVETLLRAALNHPDHLFNPSARAATVKALRATAARHGLTRQFERHLRRAMVFDVPRTARSAVDNIARASPLFPCDPSVTNICTATLRADSLRSDPQGATWRQSGLQLLGRGAKLRSALASARVRLR